MRQSNEALWCKLLGVVEARDGAVADVGKNEFFGLVAAIRAEERREFCEEIIDELGMLSDPDDTDRKILRALAVPAANEKGA